MDPKAKEVFRHPELVEKMSKGNFDFVMELYQKCVTGNEENMCISPIGISTALGMVLVGAKGSTQDQIRNSLRLDQTSDTKTIEDTYEDLVQNLGIPDKPGTILVNANGMYIHKNAAIVPAFKKLLETKFNAAANNVDFVADGENVRVEINSFVETLTNNLVKDFVESDMIPQDASAVLVNAIYFTGGWMEKFEPEFTKMEDFKLSEETTKKVNMMHTKWPFLYAKSNDLGCTMISIPYDGERLALHVLLPTEVSGLANLESKLNSDSWSKLLESSDYQEMRFYIPRFKLESAFELEDILKTAGMPTSFVSGQADFSGITANESLHISKFLHKAVLEVKEDGVELPPRRFPWGSCDPGIEIIVDHPFLVFVRDTYSGLLLFAGRVTNPV